MYINKVEVLSEMKQGETAWNIGKSGESGDMWSWVRFLIHASWSFMAIDKDVCIKYTYTMDLSYLYIFT